MILLVCLFTLLTIALLAATLLPMTNLSAWWVRDCDFPRVQLACLACINCMYFVCLFFLIGDEPPLSNATLLTLCAINLGCLAYQLYWIVPYSPLYKKEVAEATAKGSMVTILSANVLTPNPNKSCLIELIDKHAPDIIVTLESDKKWQTALTQIESTYKYSIKCPQDNLYGIHVYSKIKLINPRVHFLIEKDIPSITTGILINDTLVECYFLHPAPPSPTENASSKERDSELISVAKTIGQRSEARCSPVIVTGDLNDVAWSKSTRLFKKLSGLRDPRVGRGMFNTFHADYAWLRWPLDHIFVSSHFKLASMARVTLRGSDHFSLLTTLALSIDICELNSESTEKQPLSEEEKDLIKTRENEIDYPLT